MKKFFSLNSIKETIRFGDRKGSSSKSVNSTERLNSNKRLSTDRVSSNKRLSTLSTNSLSSRQSYLNIEVIREGYNVDLSRVDNTFTKLHRACLLNYDEKKLLKYIKKQPSTINQIDNVVHCSPMHLCVVNNNINHLNLLIQNGGDVNLIDGKGKTLLIKAIECANEQIMQFLIKNRAEVNKPDTKYKNSPLHWACLTGYYKGISTLLNCTHINVNQANEKEETALHLIAKSNKNLYVFINDCLDNNGVDLDKQDLKGRTPLFIACLYGNYHCVEILLNSNANPMIHNLIGESPLQIAKSKNFNDIVDLFEKNLTRNQYLKEIKLNSKETNDQKSSYPINQLKDSSNQLNHNNLLNQNKRNSVFSFNSDIESTKIVNDEDSWPETVSNISIDDHKKDKTTAVKQLQVSTNEDQNSFNSFKMNKNYPVISSSTSSLNLLNDLKTKNEVTSSINQVSKIVNKPEIIKVTTKEEPITSNKQILHPENDEFIKQMKFLIDEEIEMNDELDEIIFSNQQDTLVKKDKSIEKQNQFGNIYLSDDEDWANENDTLIKKPNVTPITNQPDQSVQQSNSSLRQKNLIYGLSDEEDEQKANIKKDTSTETTSSNKNQIQELAISEKDKQNTENNTNNDNQIDQMNANTNQDENANSNKIKNEIYISDSSLSTIQSSKEEDLVDKFETLMAKVSEFEEQNQKLSIELSEALEREKILKNLNNELNEQFEEQNHQLNLIESRLRQSEQNYQLIKQESEQFKNDFKIEREKFEREFVKFIQEEHKQTEQHLMKLLDDKQEMCDRLVEELNNLKSQNREKIPFLNDELVKKLEGNPLFTNLMKQNDKLNQNFQQLQKYLDEHQMLTESIKKVNQILINLEDQFKEQTDQFKKQMTNQQNEFSQFIETNVVQYIQNLFKTEVELKLIQVKSVVDELKQDLIDFIENYKLPKHNEEEITNLINQILTKSIKQSSLIYLNNSEEDLNQDLNQDLNRDLNRNINGDDLIIKNKETKKSLKSKNVKIIQLKNSIKELNDSKEEESNSSKDEAKTSLEFDADDLFDEKRMSDKEIEIKRIKKIKKNNAKLFRKINNQIEKQPNDRPLISQYSDAILNSINDFDRRLNKNFVQKNEFNFRNSSNYDQYTRKLNEQYLERDLFNFQSRHLIHSKFKPFKSINRNYLNDLNSSNNVLENNLQTKFETINDFQKRRQILEQDISNLKLQLGIFPS